MAELDEQQDHLAGILTQTDWMAASGLIESLDDHELTNILSVLFANQKWFSIQHQRLALLGYFLESTTQGTPIELIFAIALVNHEYDIETALIPQQLVYIRLTGERIDPFKHYANFTQFQQRIVREQRIEPHQFGSWSIKIFEEYIHGWKTRNPQVTASSELLFQLAKKQVA